MLLDTMVSCFPLTNDPGWLGQKACQHFAPSKYVLSMMEHASKILIYLLLKGRKSTVALVQIDTCYESDRHRTTRSDLVICSSRAEFLGSCAKRGVSSFESCRALSFVGHHFKAVRGLLCDSIFGSWPVGRFVDRIRQRRGDKRSPSLPI